MKLPFEFGLKLFFRLLVPGLLLSLGLLPVCFFLTDLGGWQIKREYVFVATIVLAGFLIMISDMPAYMLFEGRRYWPEPIRLWFLQRLQNRVSVLKAKATVTILNSIHAKRTLLAASDPTPQALLDIARGEREYQEAQFDLRQFPQDDQFEHYVGYPSRLGNIIAAYESYSTRSYGMDAVFYWPRLWLKLDKETREEVDNQQAVADSGLYCSLALYLSGLLWLVYDISFAVNSLVVKLAPGRAFNGFKVTLFEYLPDMWLSWLLFPTFMVSGYVVYRASLRLHSQFGETFKAVFDVFAKEIDISEPLNQIAPSIVPVSPNRRAQLLAVFRYLQHGLVKCPNCDTRMRPGEAKTHKCASQIADVKPLTSRAPVVEVLNESGAK